MLEFILAGLGFIIQGGLLATFMAGWRFVVAHAVYDYGLIGWLACMGVIFGAAFWIDRKWPTPSPDPPGTSNMTKHKLDMLSHVNLAGLAFFGVMFFIPLWSLPIDWLWYWMIPWAIAYVRWHLVCMRREKKLLAEDNPIETDPDYWSMPEAPPHRRLR